MLCCLRFGAWGPRVQGLSELGFKIRSLGLRGLGFGGLGFRV